jgi:cyclic di-GMP phosphodiesterase
MTEQQLPPNTEKISLSKLRIGMYVVAVFKKDKNIRVKSEGYITNKESISKLKKMSIVEVEVDPSKEKKQEKSLPQINSTPLRKKTSPTEKKVPIEVEMRKANKLYNDAKGLQNKLLDEIKAGSAIDVSEVKQSTDAIVDSIFNNQDALSCMSRLRMKDEYLIEHSLNVSILMTIFAKYLGVDKAIIEQLALGAFLHDVGKVLVPSEVLNKPGRLTSEEYEVMKQHVTFGIKLLGKLPDLSDIAKSTVHEHHERLDGKGYPNALNAEQITEYGRMIAIVDSYDAMTAERVYKAGMSPIKAFKILVSDAPNSYDETLVDKFVQCLGLYPVGTFVKLTSGKLGLISQLNKSRPLHPFVKVFYNTRLNQAIPIVELNLSESKHKDQIESCIKPEEFKINLPAFFKAAFLE